MLFEKLAYDLYQLCGVFVPDNFLVEDKGNLCIASEILPGFKKLDELSNIRSKDQFRSTEHLNQRRAEALSKQQFNGKPIRGFFENLAAFGFVFDYDGLGQSFDNFGFIEKPDHYQFVKIDPGQASLLTRHDGKPIETNGFRALNQHESTILGEWDLGERCGWNYKKAFRSATYEQKLDGLGRIANLSDAIINQTVNNTAGIDYIPEAKRKKIVIELIRRRDLFKDQYKEDLKHYKAKQIEADMEVKKDKENDKILNLDEYIKAYKENKISYHKDGIKKEMLDQIMEKICELNVKGNQVVKLNCLIQIYMQFKKLNLLDYQSVKEYLKTINNKENLDKLNGFSGIVGKCGAFVKQSFFSTGYCETMSDTRLLVGKLNAFIEKNALLNEKMHYDREKNNCDSYLHLSRAA